MSSLNNDKNLKKSKNVRSFLEDAAIKSESESIDIFTTDPLMDSNEASDIYLSFKESLENLQQMNFEDILHINLFKNMHIITEQVLNSLAISLELDDIEQFPKIIHYFLGIWNIRGLAILAVSSGITTSRTVEKNSFN